MQPQSLRFLLDQLDMASAIVRSFPEELDSPGFRHLFHCATLHASAVSTIRSIVSRFPSALGLAHDEHAAPSHDLVAAYNLIILAEELAVEARITPEDDADTLSHAQVSLARVGALLRGARSLLGGHHGPDSGREAA